MSISYRERKAIIETEIENRLEKLTEKQFQLIETGYAAYFLHLDNTIIVEETKAVNQEILEVEDRVMTMFDDADYCEECDFQQREGSDDSNYDWDF